MSISNCISNSVRRAQETKVFSEIHVGLFLMTKLCTDIELSYCIVT